MPSPRVLATLVASLAVAAGAFYWVSNLTRPEGNRAPNVAESPAGGRTQAKPPDADPHAGLGSTVDAPGDPLVAGVPEKPDVPPDAAHGGIKKVGERIRDAVLADGHVGDDEVPGVAFAGLSQSQRRWFLDHGVALTCPCGCRQDLLECRRDDATCPTSPRLADSLLMAAKAQK